MCRDSQLIVYSGVQRSSLLQSIHNNEEPGSPGNVASVKKENQLLNTTLKTTTATLLHCEINNLRT